MREYWMSPVTRWVGIAVLVIIPAMLIAGISQGRLTPAEPGAFYMNLFLGVLVVYLVGMLIWNGSHCPLARQDGERFEVLRAFTPGGGWRCYDLDKLFIVRRSLSGTMFGFTDGSLAHLRTSLLRRADAKELVQTMRERADRQKPEGLG
ncbi:hypothetical protein ACN2MM_04275 [Alkalilimnicola ehrlichii MLHE-1]